MYVMGNYPLCYVQVHESNKELLSDPRVYEVNPRTFRHASKTKTANREINLLRRELTVLKAITKLPEDEQLDALIELEELEGTELEERRKEENEDLTPDKDPNVLKKRRLEDDRKREFPDPEDAKLKAELESMNQSKYSVLSYKVGSLQYEDTEDGDKFMRQIIGGHKEIENGDKLMQDIGAS